MTIGVPATTGTNDDFVFTSYDVAPVGGSSMFPSGSVLNAVATTQSYITSVVRRSR